MACCPPFWRDGLLPRWAMGTIFKSEATAPKPSLQTGRIAKNIEICV